MFLNFAKEQTNPDDKKKKKGWFGKKAKVDQVKSVVSENRSLVHGKGDDSNSAV